MPAKETPEDNKNEMKLYLRTWRHLCGYKQADFARLLGVSPATLSRYENNKGDLSIIRINNIAKALHINYTQLLQDPEDVRLLIQPTKKVSRIR